MYAPNKQPKPAASKLEQLWSDEWTTRVNADLAAAHGVLDFEGFFGTYQYEVRIHHPPLDALVHTLWPDIYASERSRWSSHAAPCRGAQVRGTAAGSGVCSGTIDIKKPVRCLSKPRPFSPSDVMKSCTFPYLAGA